VYKSNNVIRFASTKFQRGPVGLSLPIVSGVHAERNTCPRNRLNRHQTGRKAFAQDYSISQFNRIRQDQCQRRQSQHAASPQSDGLFRIQNIAE
jgi:hypothetical protein